MCITVCMDVIHFIASMLRGLSQAQTALVVQLTIWNIYFLDESLKAHLTPHTSWLWDSVGLFHPSISAGYLFFWKSPSASAVTYFAFQNEMDHLSVKLVLRYTCSTIGDFKNQPFFSLRKWMADASRPAEQTLCSAALWKKNKADACASKRDFFPSGPPALVTLLPISSAPVRRTYKGLETMQVNLVCLSPPACQERLSDDMWGDHKAFR